MQPNDCPSRQELAALAVGRLAPEAVDEVSEHVDTCLACREILETLRSTEDPLVAALGRAAPKDNFSAEPEFQRDMAQVNATAQGRSDASGTRAADAAQTSAPEGAATSVHGKQTAPPTGPVPPTSEKVRKQGGSLPENFGRYRIIKCLGQGGMGAVYLAHDTQLDRQVAMKVPHFSADAGPEVLERFYRESRAAATLDHPNICPVYDAGEIDGVHYLVMAYIEGKSLSEFVSKDKPIPQRQVAAIVRKLALALQEAHTHGVVHRDLKPANIMVNKRRELVVMDFGLARLMKKSADSEHRLTQSGVIMGTPSYMPPEQVMGDVKAMGPACDIYSLGVIMYELLTGWLPFRGTLTAVLAQIVVDRPAPPSQHRPDLDSQLEVICLKAMAKKIEDRYGSMDDLAKSLGDYLAGRGPAAESAADRRVRPSLLAEKDRGPQVGPEKVREARPPDAPVAKPAKSGAPAPGSPRPREPADKGRTPKQPASSGRAVSQPAVSRVADENLEQFFAAVVAEEETPLARSKPSRRSAKPPSRSPHWPWLAAAGAAALLVLGGIIYIATNKGTIKIELNDPDAVVRVDGDVITIEKLGEPITLRAGEHELVVKRGDIELETRSFTVRRGNNPALRVELEPKFASKAAGAVPAKPQGKTTEQPPTTATPPKTPSQLSSTSEWVSLFNRSGLSGWEGLMEYWTVKDGTLVGSSLPDGVNENTFLCSKRKYKDFELKFQVRLKDGRGNSGVQIRSEFIDRGKFIVRGPQCDIGGQYWGSLYGEQFGGMMKQAPREKVTAVLKPDDFNDYSIRCIGKHVTIQVNGVTTVDDDFATLPDEGIIAWQIHSGQPMEVTFRNVEFRDLSQPAVIETGVAGTRQTGEWVSLSNGRDLTGWQVMGPAGWTVADQVIRADGSASGWLATERDYADFELELEYRLPPGGNSGVFLRAWPEGALHGGQFLEIQLLDDDAPSNINVSAERRNGSIYSSAAPTARPAAPAGSWNTLRVRAEGSRVQAWLGGTQIQDVNLDDYAQNFERFPGLKRSSGRIGLQMHRTSAEFRNIRVRDLAPAARDAAGWVPLFNGRDLAGWKGNVNYWKVQDGVIVGKMPTERVASYSYLCTERTYRDFELRLQAKLLGGNSGVQVRSTISDTQNFDVAGPQVEIAPARGIIWGTVVTAPTHNPSLAVSSADDVQKILRPNDFNELVITCVGRHITVKLNGTTVNDADFPSMPDEGILALQLHKSHPGMEVQFKDITIRETTVGTGASKTTSQPSTADSDRRVAEWALSLGGELVILHNDASATIKPGQALPPSAFRVNSIELIAKTKEVDLVTLALVGQLTELESLSLAALPLTDADVDRMTAGGRAPKLTHLYLANCDLSTACLAHRTRWTSLEHLTLDAVPLKGGDLTALKRLPKLHHLNIGSSETQNADLTGLAGLELRTMIIGYIDGLTDDGLGRLADLTTIEILHVGATSLTGSALERFARMPRLRLLGLNFCGKLAPASLRSLEAAKSLERLELCGCPIRDDHLAYLSGLKQLKELNLTQTQMTAAGVKKLAASLPQCKIESDHGTIKPK